VPGEESLLSSRRASGASRTANAVIASAVLVLGTFFLPAPSAVKAESILGGPYLLPQNLSVEPGNAVVRVTWDAPLEPLSDVLSYEVYRWGPGEGGGSALLGGEPEIIAETYPDTFEYYDFDVTSQDDYWYTVRARYDNKTYSTTPAPVEARTGVVSLNIVLQVDEPTAKVNLEEVNLDAPPQFVDGSTMVPIRFITASLGAEVRYDSGPQQITIVLGARAIRLWVGRSEAEVDGATMRLAAPPVVVNGRTLVPLRFISEAFGARVDYHPDGQVIINLLEEDDMPHLATEIAVGATVKAALNGSRDVDYYRFVPQANAIYVVSTHDLAPDCDTVLTVLEGEPEALTVLNQDNDCVVGYPESGIIVSQGKEPGVVYLRVQSALPGGANPSGNYSLTVEERPEKELPAISAETQTVTGELLSPTDVDCYFLHCLRADLVEIKVTGLPIPAEDGNGGYTDTALTVWNPRDMNGYVPEPGSENGPELELLTVDLGPWSGGDSCVVFQPPVAGSNTGYYLIQVFSETGRCGPYSMEINQTTDPEPANDWNTAIAIVPDRQRIHGWLTIEVADWYKFEATVGTTYWIQTNDLAPQVDTEILLYGPAGRSMLERNDDALGVWYGSRLEWQAEASGTYYVEVRPNLDSDEGSRAPIQGGYGFCITTTGPEPDDYDRLLEVALVPGEEAKRASLVDGDADWFTFKVENGFTYAVETLNLGPGCDTYLVLVDEDYNILAANDNENAGGSNEGTASLASSVEWTATYSGTVHVLVTVAPVPPDSPGYDPGCDPTGTYEIRVTREAEGMSL